MLRFRSIKSWHPGGHISYKATSVLLFLLLVAVQSPAVGNIFLPHVSPIMAASFGFCRYCDPVRFHPSLIPPIKSSYPSQPFYTTPEVKISLFLLGDRGSTCSRLETREGCLSLLPLCRQEGSRDGGLSIPPLPISLGQVFLLVGRVCKPHSYTALRTSWVRRI